MSETKTDDAKLAEIRAAIDAADQGGYPTPWHKETIEGSHFVCFGPQDDPSECFDVFEDPREVDAVLTVLLRNNAKWLLSHLAAAQEQQAAQAAELERVRGENSQLRETIGGLSSRLYAGRQLWVDIVDDEVLQRAQAEADQHQVPIDVVVHGRTAYTAKPKQIADLTTALADEREKVAALTRERDTYQRGHSGLMDLLDRLEDEAAKVTPYPEGFRPSGWEALADLPGEFAKVKRERDEALRQCAEWASQAGLAKGELMASEMAGNLRGWKERAERAEGELAEGLHVAWAEVERLARSNAQHRRGFRLNELDSEAILEQARAELYELMRAVERFESCVTGTDREIAEELADVLGVLFHFGIRMKYTPVTLSRTMLAKFRDRFTTPTPAAKEGE